MSDCIWGCAYCGEEFPYSKGYDKEKGIVICPECGSDDTHYHKEDNAKSSLLDLLKEGLSIEFTTHHDYDGKGYKATIKFEGEEICSDYFITEKEDYYY